MKTIRMHSNGMIYAPGFFRFITQGCFNSCSANDQKMGRKLLKEFGFKPKEIAAVVKGKFTTEVQDETLIVTITIN